MSCEHNNRVCDITGFRCKECGEFFPKNSPIYRSTELLSSLEM